MVWNYLRVRGEYPLGVSSLSPLSELPPRARRIHFINKDFVCTLGTTSACAENTYENQGKSQVLRNYLRVRGEYSYLPVSCHKIRELPPRARRIRSIRALYDPKAGTTSACAENTH